jgi:putative MATE family efflux protein
MRAIKRMKVGLVANVVGVVCNIVFNYLFMFGGLGIEPMGFMGAAYGTILSRTVELVVTVAGLIIGKYPLFSRLRDMFVFERRFVARYFKMFFPILCNELFWVLSSTVYLYVYDKLPSSEVVLAAMNIAQSVDKIVSVAMIGIGSAAGIVIGNAIGEGDMPKVRSWANSCITFSIISGILIGVLTLLLSFVAPSFFTNVSLEAQEVAKRLLWLFSLTAVFRTLCFMQVIGILRAGGDTTYCMVWETLAIWLVSVPLVILGGSLGWNIYILYTLGSICEVIKCIIFGVRVKGSRWLKFVSE